MKINTDEIIGGINYWSDFERVLLTTSISADIPRHRYNFSPPMKNSIVSYRSCRGERERGSILIREAGRDRKSRLIPNFECANFPNWRFVACNCLALTNKQARRVPLPPVYRLCHNRMKTRTCCTRPDRAQHTSRKTETILCWSLPFPCYAVQWA